jgi:hypothetical protein
MPHGTFGFSFREPPLNQRIHTDSVRRAWQTMRMTCARGQA